MSWMSTIETSLWRTTKTSLVFSLETCLRRCGNLLMRRCCYVLLGRRHNVPIRGHGDIPLRCLGNVPSSRCWGFHLRRNCDVAGMYRETSLQRYHEVFWQCGKWSYFIVLLPLFPNIVGNVSFIITFFSVYKVIVFKINSGFLFKKFCDMRKKTSRQIS